MDAVHAAGDGVAHGVVSRGPCRGRSRGGVQQLRPAREKLPLAAIPGALGDEVVTMPEDEFASSIRARLRIPYPSFLLRFRRERGPP